MPANSVTVCWQPADKHRPKMNSQQSNLVRSKISHYNNNHQHPSQQVSLEAGSARDAACVSSSIYVQDPIARSYFIDFLVAAAAAAGSIESSPAGASSWPSRLAGLLPLRNERRKIVFHFSRRQRKLCVQITRLKHVGPAFLARWGRDDDDAEAPIGTSDHRLPEFYYFLSAMKTSRRQ